MVVELTAPIPQNRHSSQITCRASAGTWSGQNSRRSMPKSFAVVSLVLLVVLGTADSRADEKPNGELPARVATHHTMELNTTGLNERRLDYEAVAEILPVTDAKGNTPASLFTFSYLTDGNHASARLVSFVFNGGPGAA